MKRLLALMTAVVMVLAMASVAFADSSTPTVIQDTQTEETGETTTTTTQTLPDGTTVETTETTTEDGTTVTEVTTTTPDGEETTETEVELSEEATEEEVATLPIVIIAAPSVESASTVKVTLPASASENAIEKIEVPVSNNNNNTVIYLVDEAGNTTLLKETLKTEDGVTFPVGEETEYSVKVVNNEKEFEDSADVAAWAKSGVEFATSRELFVGNDAQEIMPEGTMTIAEMVTVLSRAADAGLEDTGDNWYEAPMAWADGQGMNPEGSEATDEITRQQLAYMLYKLAGSPETTGDLSSFPDADTAADMYTVALQWAVETGILQGDGTNLNPTGTASRQEIMTMMARYYAAK